jgi:hypothetical protein
MTSSHPSNSDLSTCPGGLLLSQDEDAKELAKAAIKLRTPAAKTPAGSKRKAAAQQAAGKKQSQQSRQRPHARAAGMVARLQARFKQRQLSAVVRPFLGAGRGAMPWL